MHATDTVFANVRVNGGGGMCGKWAGSSAVNLNRGLLRSEFLTINTCAKGSRGCSKTCI